MGVSITFKAYLQRVPVRRFYWSVGSKKNYLTKRIVFCKIA
jgi:hypothetical protein